MAETANDLGVSFVLYQLRHSGPSSDRLQRKRDLLEIQKRGNWRIFASVVRYEKSAAIAAEYARYSVGQRLYFEDCARHLEEYVTGTRVVPDLPWGKRQ